MRALLVAILGFYCVVVFAQEEYYQQQQEIIQQQQSFYIEDVLVELEYHQHKIDSGKGTEFDHFKVQKLKQRLTEIQDLSTQSNQ